ncbi:MAG: hypothetical protein KAS32_15195 [Candidatus Peribacteraceae bacterium]|nr:hypothetical protein [Candidatus Peribacteraceae bacterium]
MRNNIYKIITISLILFSTTVMSEEVETIPMIKTNDGQVYLSVKVKRVSHSHITIYHSKGIDNIHLSRLSEELQEKYGYSVENEKKIKENIKKNETKKQINIDESFPDSEEVDFKKLTNVQIDKLRRERLAYMESLRGRVVEVKCKIDNVSKNTPGVRDYDKKTDRTITIEKSKQIEGQGFSVISASSEKYIKDGYLQVYIWINDEDALKLNKKQIITVKGRPAGINRRTIYFRYGAEINN